MLSVVNRYESADGQPALCRFSIGSRTASRSIRLVSKASRPRSRIEIEAIPLSFRVTGAQKKFEELIYQLMSKERRYLISKTRKRNCRGSCGTPLVLCRLKCGLPAKRFNFQPSFTQESKQDLLRTDHIINVLSLANNAPNQASEFYRGFARNQRSNWFWQSLAINVPNQAKIRGPSGPGNN